MRGRPGLRRLIPLAGLIAATAVVPPALWLLRPDDPEPRREERSLTRGRALNLRYSRDYQYEASFEKCEAMRIEDLAGELGVPAKPDAVATAYARGHSPAVRAIVARGCQDAFADRWDPPTE